MISTTRLAFDRYERPVKGNNFGHDSFLVDEVLNLSLEGFTARR